MNSKLITFEIFNEKKKILLKPHEKSWIHVFRIDEELIESIPEMTRGLNTFKNLHGKTNQTKKKFKKKKRKNLKMYLWICLKILKTLMNVYFQEKFF